jgi:hypothetical protein
MSNNITKQTVRSSLCGSAVQRFSGSTVQWKLMAAWAAFCSSAPKEAQDSVTQLRR